MFAEENIELNPQKKYDCGESKPEVKVRQIKKEKKISKPFEKNL